MAAYGHVEQQNNGVYGSQRANMQYGEMPGREVAVQHGGQEVNDGNHGADVIKNENLAGTVQPSDEDNDCFTVVRTSKHMEIPCTRNEYRRYKVSVPKTVHERVPRRVQYTDFETREREEPYTVKRCETAYRDEEQPYTVQVPKKVTRMVKVTKKVPKTVYVDVVTEEPQESTVMVPETRTRKVKVPYQKEVIDQKYRKVKENVPVTKYRTEFDTVSKTIYEDAWRTKVVPVTKIIRKEIPVYNVVPTGDCGNCEQIQSGVATNANEENPATTEQEPTYKSDIEQNSEVQQPQPTPAQYNNTNINPGQSYQAIPQYEQASAAPSRVMQQPVAQPAPNGMMQQSVGRPASIRQPHNSHRPAAAPLRASAQMMNYQNGAQWMNQQEAAPVTNEAPPQYDQRVQQMYSVPQHYANTNNGNR